MPGDSYPRTLASVGGRASVMVRDAGASAVPETHVNNTPTSHKSSTPIMLVSLTVGKVDAGVAVLLTEDKRLVRAP